jgi:hypothetical protein
MPSRQLSTNWILAYADAVDKMSESPAAFNVWCAISVISAVLKNNVFVSRGLYKIFPNQYIVLVSPPGIGKGSAIHPAHNFVKNPPSKVAMANYMSDRITAPKIIEKLAAGFPVTRVVNGSLHSTTEASAVLQAAELSTFLGSSDWMTSFLCDAWDRGEFEYDTKSKGTNIVKNMCVSLIGACVPDFIRSINKDAGVAVNGGFTARTIFVFATDKSKSIVWPTGFESTATNRAISDKLWHDLEIISRLNGEFKWSPTAMVLFERFYKGITVEEHDSDVVRHFKARQSTHVLKVAMCMSAAGRDDLVIDDYEITTAINFVDAVKRTLDVTFRGVGESPLAEAMARVQTYIERKGVTSFSEILRDNYRHIVREDLERVLYTLEAVQIIQRITNSGNIKYKYRGLPATNGHKP